jgi:hypothetical protein
LRRVGFHEAALAPPLAALRRRARARDRRATGTENLRTTDGHAATDDDGDRGTDAGAYAAAIGGPHRDRRPPTFGDGRTRAGADAASCTAGRDGAACTAGSPSSDGERVR